MRQSIIVVIITLFALKSSADFASDCVTAHNAYRTPLNIAALTWSADIAQSAQAWADKLAAEGDLTHSSSNYGENLASRTGHYTPDAGSSSNTGTTAPQVQDDIQNGNTASGSQNNNNNNNSSDQGNSNSNNTPSNSQNNNNVNSNSNTGSVSSQDGPNQSQNQNSGKNKGSNSNRSSQNNNNNNNNDSNYNRNNHHQDDSSDDNSNYYNDGASSNRRRYNDGGNGDSHDGYRRRGDRNLASSKNRQNSGRSNSNNNRDSSATTSSSNSNTVSSSSSSGSNTPIVNKLIDQWGAEKQYFVYGTYPDVATSGQKVGHYTQMVWGDTKQVGCGISNSNDGWVYLVCQYYPAGNMRGDSVY